MDSWQRINGVDWVSPEDPDLQHPLAEIGLIFAHGYAHESPAELGITAAAASSLVRELSRPREAGGHRPLELEVATEVNLQDTVLVLRGNVEALREGARTVQSILARPDVLEVAIAPNSRRFRWSGWTNELVAWLGMGPVGLAAELEDPWVGSAAQLQDFVRRLDPASGRPMTAWTTDPGLVGVAFQGPPGPSTLAYHPLTWREPSPTATGPGSVTATFDNNVLSARVPTTPGFDVAVRLVARTVHRNLVELTQLVAALRFSAEQVGAETLFAVRAVPNAGETNWAEVRSALLQALDASASFLDVILAEEIDRARTPESIELDLELATQAMSALRSGKQLTRGELMGQLDGLTVPQLRLGIEQLQAASLVGVPEGQDPPSGRPGWQPRPLPPVTRPYVSRRSVVRLPYAGGLVRSDLRATPAILQQTRRGGMGHGKTGQTGRAASTALDLRNVVVRIDSGNTWTTLIDRDNHRLTVAWPAYRRTAPLRSLVDAAAPPQVRVSWPESRQLTAALRSRLRNHRLRIILPLGFLLLIVALLWLPSALKTYQQPVVTTVAVGTVVTLANGSTVQVSNLESRKTAYTHEPVLLVDVRYCGGGVTVDRNTSRTARNYVTWERFRGTGVRQIGLGAVPLRAGESPMGEAELAQGQCTGGKLGFVVVDPALSPSQRRIDYRNGSGDTIGWTLG